MTSATRLQADFYLRTDVLQVARDLDEGVVVTVLPDSGYKYLSERFWQE